MFTCFILEMMAITDNHNQYTKGYVKASFDMEWNKRKDYDCDFLLRFWMMD